MPDYVESGVSYHQPNSFSESQNFQSGMSASFTEHQNKGSVSLGYNKVKWPTSSCSLASLLSYKEGLIVYSHSAWHGPIGQSCPVLACLPHPMVWLGDALLVESTMAKVAGLASLYTGSMSQIS